MKVLQINTIYPNGSTGKIARGIKELCDRKQIDCRVAYRYRERNGDIADTYVISSYLDCHVHNRLSRYTMFQGCFSKIKTRLFLKKISKYAPDIIHLHNIHGSFINHKQLFDYIKKHNVRLVWTFHDCWPFTGHCPHFAVSRCDKWMSECHQCPQKGLALIDNSRQMYKNKKKWFTDVKNATIVTPSEWLAGVVRQSFMRDYPVKIINNGIDLSVFKPTDSDFREKRSCQNKHILLGVAFGWGYKKGLDVFVELSKRLPSEYQIVLVGTDDDIDKQLPDNIISIHRTNNQAELAEIYTAADVFANPTREETLGLTTVEALACGTPAVVFRAGGAPECVDNSCGSVIDVDDIDAMEREIIRICEEKPYSKEDCILRASRFDMKKRFEEYVDLYRKVVER